MTTRRFRIGPAIGWAVVSVMLATSMVAEAQENARKPLRVQVLGAESSNFEGSTLWARGPGEVAKDLPASGVATLSLEPGTWTVGVDVPGYWAPEVVLGDAWPEEAVIRLRKLSVLRATVTSGGGNDRAQSEPRGLGAARLRVREAVAAQTHEGFGPTFVCEISDREVQCPVLAGLVDLRLEVDGFVPIHRWSVGVSEAKPLDLGRLRLRRGASVAGWIDRAGLTGQLVVELRVADRGVPNSSLESSRGTLASKTKVRENGFFSLAGVPPGLYELRVAIGQEQMVVARREIDLGRSESVELPGVITLEAPGRVEVVVSPPVSPGGERWEFVIMRSQTETSSRIERVSEGVVGEAGGVSVEGLEAGHYSIDILRGRDRALRQEFEVNGPETTVFLDVDWIEIAGRVSIGSDALPGAEVLFGERGGAQEIRYAADEDGEFLGWLPREGPWKVSVSGAATEEVRLEAVEIRRRRDGRASPVELELPATRLTGRVMFRSGRAAETATVSVWQDGSRRARVQTARDGSFEIQGLPVGEVKVEAMALSGAAARQRPIHLLEDGEVEVELIVEPRVEIRGRLFEEGAPAVGAVVVVWPRAGTESGSRTAADHSGAFELQVLEGMADVVIATRSRTQLAAWSIDAKPREALRIDLNRGVGTLVFKASPEGASEVPLVGYEGAFVRLTEILAVSRVEPDGSAIRLPTMAAGAYAVCTAAAGCEEQVLAAGGEVVFELGGGR